MELNTNTNTANTIMITNKKTSNKNINNNDIIVNFSCFCSKWFKCNEKILYILPCCHVVHEKCFNEHILRYQYKNFDLKDNKIRALNCPFCSKKIKIVLTEYKINTKKKYYQYKIDVKSLRLDNSALINYMALPSGIIKFTSLFNKLVNAYTLEDIMNCIEYFLKYLNIKLHVHDNTVNNPIEIKDNRIIWKNKIDNEQKLVIISNHAHYIDSVILYYLFRCGFVSSDFINHTDIGRIIVSKLKILVFRRNVDTNMVDKIKSYLDEQKRIVIYPEGGIINNETIVRFRTGAFYVNETICPVVIKYDKVIYDDDFKQMLLKVITQSEINVNVYINDFYYPPFDNDKIDKIRSYMAFIGKFEKSRVSNKSYN